MRSVLTLWLSRYVMAACTGWFSPGPLVLAGGDQPAENLPRRVLPIEQRQLPSAQPLLRGGARQGPGGRAQLLQEVMQVDEAMDPLPEALRREPRIEHVPHLGSSVAEELELEFGPFADERGHVCRQAVPHLQDAPWGMHP
jgi:hypothetical protein